MLMIAGLGGDTAAYRQLLAASAERLRRYFARRLGQDSADIEDLVQEALMAIHQRRESYSAALPYTAWLHAIARYKLVDHFRRNGVRRSLPIDDVEEFFADDALEPALAAFDIEALLATLPEKHRTAIRLTRIEGYSVAEASRRSGQSIAAVKVNIHRGIGRLMKLVKGSGQE